MVGRLSCAALALTSGCWLVEGGPAPSYEKIVLADGPLAYWRVGEANGPTAVDASMHHYDAEYEGAVTFGRPGAIVHDANAGVRLDGSEGTLIDPPSGLQPWAGDFTLEAWIAPLAVSGTFTHEGIFVWELYNTHGFRFGWRDDYAPVFWTTESGGYDSVESPMRLSRDTWNHVVLTKTGPTIAIYLDGSLAVAETAPTYIPPTSSDPNSCWGACSGLEAHGDFDELAIYDRALSAAQVARHYEAGTR